MIAIFITNEDRDEFRKYQRGVAQRNDGKWKIDQTFMVRSFHGDKTASAILILKGDFQAKLLLRDKKIVSPSSINDPSGKGKENAQYCVDAFLDYIEQQYKTILGDCKDKNVKTVCFTHWGGGDVDSIPQHEIWFQSCYDGFKSEYADSPLGGNIRFYSISTIRPHLFDVSGDVIHVPYDVKELEDLYRRFELEQMAERNFQYGYVLAYQTGENVPSFPGERRELFAKYLKNKRDRWAKMFYSKEEKARRRKLIDKTLKVLPKYSGSNQDMKPDKEIAELFSIILQEEAPHE